jgi:hypothetical protein
MIQYLIVSPELKVTIWFPYLSYNDILRYYNVTDQLHKHEAIQSHYTLTIL